MEYSLRQGYGKSMAILVLGKLVSTTYNWHQGPYQSHMTSHNISLVPHMLFGRWGSWDLRKY